MRSLICRTTGADECSQVLRNLKTRHRNEVLPETCWDKTLECQIIPVSGLFSNQKSVENRKALLYTAWAFCEESLSAQVAQAVERSPEKAGVGGSTPSLGTICSLH